MSTKLKESPLGSTSTPYPEPPSKKRNDLAIELISGSVGGASQVLVGQVGLSLSSSLCLVASLFLFKRYTLPVYACVDLSISHHDIATNHLESRCAKARSVKLMIASRYPQDGTSNVTFRTTTTFCNIGITPNTRTRGSRSV